VIGGKRPTYIKREIGHVQIQSAKTKTLRGGTNVIYVGLLSLKILSRRTKTMISRFLKTETGSVGNATI
jgi:hypothetical protein